MKNVILITQSYPFGQTETFLHTEIEYLAKAFDSIIVIPIHNCDGDPRELPENCSVVTDFIKAKTSVNRLFFLYKGVQCFLFGFLTWCKYVRRNKHRFNVRYLRKYLNWLGLTIFSQQWFGKYFYQKNLKIDETILYSYWLTYFSVAGKSSSLKNPFYSISRAHGFDLYDERQEPADIFWKSFLLENIDKLYLISEHAVAYVKEKFPAYHNKLSMSRLGTRDPGHFNNYTDNHISPVLYVVSCSNVNSVKRVHLIIESFKELEKMKPGIRVNWTHIGDGDLYEEIKQKAKNLPATIAVDFVGRVTNDVVYHYYINNPVDVFINVSLSEGLPVSIMEAQSFGIPVIATDVGGTSEIVSSTNGYLLSANPTATEIAQVLSDIIQNRDIWLEKRKNARQNWELNFNAEQNYKSFINEMVANS